MFTPGERAQLRSGLLALATGDARISGVAITGSAATGGEDGWSDVDLAFGVREGPSLVAVLSDFSEHMYERQLAIHHVDIHAGAWIYRAFLLADASQVDLAFAPAAEFRPLAPSFQLVSGEVEEPFHPPAAHPSDIIGMAWLHALHVRSSLGRGRLWQAEYMIGGVRDHALMLACLRHGLPTSHARGLHLLPIEVTAPFEESLVRGLDPAELARAFRVALDALRNEIRCTDADLAARLDPTLSQLL